MNPESSDRILGEYRLKALLSESLHTRTWLAEQISVSRKVLLDELRQEHADQRDAFLANVRVKAAVEHPLIGSVFEAVAEPGLCFFAHELLAGATLADRKKAGEPFKPARLAHVLMRIADAQIHHETLGQACTLLDLEHVHLDDQGVIRIDNLAIAGTRAAYQSTRDIVHLGEALPGLVADAQPGTTRLLTLLGWMRGEGIDMPLNWSQIRNFCGQIEQQLAAPAPTISPTRSGSRARKKPALGIIAAAGIAALLVVIALAMKMRPETPPSDPGSTLPGAILIPAGKHPTPDGTVEELDSFRISSHEVTIREYASFVETLEILAKDQRERIFDHETQPPEKTGHLPDDWSAMLSAAKTGGTWNQRPITMNHPVVGVDWWDAAAYAEWKKARLPTQEEWFAAMRVEVASPAAIQPSAWLPVSMTNTDRTPIGLLGMAGSVCEWTRRPAANPANPLGERKWLAIGGSYLKPGSNALTREWIDERSLRRPDLGFRLVFDAN
jgi:Sulfatase-modifying factor enzyme 1